MTRSKIAAKYINLVDRVQPVRQDPRPPYTVIQRVGQDIDLVVETPAGRSSFFLEWCDLTMKDLVGR